MATTSTTVGDPSRVESSGELNGRHLLINGPFHQIARAIALAARQSGAHVTLLTREPDTNAHAFCQDPHVRTPMRRHFVCPLDQTDAIHTCLERIREEAGPVDILVNEEECGPNRTRPGLIEQTWDDLSGGHLAGHLRVTMEVIPAMKARSWGRIIHLGCEPTQLKEFGLPHLHSVRGPLVSLTINLALQVARHGITVNAVTPGYIDGGTPPGESDPIQDLIQRSTPIGRLGRPGEIADAILFLASPGASYLTGQILAVNGGLTM